MEFSYGLNNTQEEILLIAKLSRPPFPDMLESLGRRPAGEHEEARTWRAGGWNDTVA